MLQDFEQETSPVWSLIIRHARNGFLSSWAKHWLLMLVSWHNFARPKMAGLLDGADKGYLF